MGAQFGTEAVNDSNFRLLSVAALLKKIRKGLTNEELYREAERKFDTLIDLLGNTYTDKTIISGFGYSLDELKEMSLLIFNRLIADTGSNPYVTLCVSEGASLEEIKRRRNKLLYVFHPDRNPDELTNGTNTIKINEAYALIARTYVKREKRFRQIKTRFPTNYSYRRKMMFALLIIFIVFFIILLTVMMTARFF